MPAKLKHPFLKGLSKHRGTPPSVVVIFGASGDLTARKLIPAIYNLGVDNLLPKEFYLFGFGRKKISDERFRQKAAASIAEHSRRSLNSTIWQRIAAKTFYLPGGYDNHDSFQALAHRIQKLEEEIGRKLQVLFYISTPPTVFKPILQNLGACGLAD